MPDRYPLHSPSPLFAQVESDYLEELHQYKKIIEIIGFETSKMIADSLEYARKKHPKFADAMTDGSLEKCRESLEDVRHSNDIGESCGYQVADDLLNEEYLEAIEQHLLGNKVECIIELSHTAAVIIRMMDLERKGCR